MTDMYAAENVKAVAPDDWKPFLLKILIGILVVVIIAEFSFYTIVVPVTSRINLTLSGSVTLGYDELRAAAGLTGAEKWMDFDSASTASRLASNPLFESVTVEKIFPDRVAITVIERVPVAVAFGLVDGRTVPVEIDRTGVAFRIGRAQQGMNLPLLTGLTFENPVAGMRLNNSLKPLLEQLFVLGEQNPMLLSSVSEIKIDAKTWGGFDLVVYPVNTPVRVRTDKALNEDTLQYMMLVLDVVNDLTLDVEEIDIRAGTVAYRIKGERI